MRSLFLFFGFIFLQQTLSSQDTTSRFKLLDTPSKISKIKINKKHNPHLAAIISAIAPGGGQIYNKRYWKTPIIWAGLAGIGYVWVNENNRYQEAKSSYLTLIDKDLTNDIPYNGTTNVEIVQSTKNNYRNQRDMYLLFGILFYGLNIVDAAVDAHFMNFDVSDDLSLKLDLDLKNTPNQLVVPTLTLNLKRR